MQSNTDDNRSRQSKGHTQHGGDGFTRRGCYSDSNVRSLTATYRVRPPPAAIERNTTNQKVKFMGIVLANLTSSEGT